MRFFALVSFGFFLGVFSPSGLAQEPVTEDPVPVTQSESPAHSCQAGLEANPAKSRQCFLKHYFFGDQAIPNNAYPTAEQIELLDKVFQHPSWVAALGTNLKIFLNEENKDDPNLQPVFAAPASLRTALNRTSAQLDNNISKERDLKTAIIAWSNFLLPLAAVLAVVALVWAGFLYITATEDESQIDQAKKIIWVTTIGIVLIIGSYAIVNTLLQAVQ